MRYDVTSLFDITASSQIGRFSMSDATNFVYSLLDSRILVFLAGFCVATIFATIFYVKLSAADREFSKRTKQFSGGDAGIDLQSLDAPSQAIDSPEPEDDLMHQQRIRSLLEKRLATLLAIQGQLIYESRVDSGDKWKHLGTEDGHEEPSDDKEQSQAWIEQYCTGEIAALRQILQAIASAD